MFDISKLSVSPAMLNMIADIDEFKGVWKHFGKLAPDRLQVLRKVATIESIGSSTRIEGAKLSDSEVEQLLARLDTHSFRSRDEEEVAGYASVCEEIFTSFEEIELTENVIKQLHAWLLKFSHKDERHRGEYKKFPNNVEAFDAQGKSLGVVFQTTSPFETPGKMQELVYWTREHLEHKTLHPLLVIGIFVVVFLAIHPFQDGNGRLSRVLTTLLLLKAGYTYVPYSSLESIIENSKESYYLSLRRTQQTLLEAQPEFDPWLLFFLRALQKQKNHLEVKIERENLMRLHLPVLSGDIISLLREHSRLTIGQLEELTRANRNTLKKYLSDLVSNAQIKRFGKGRGTWYTL